MVLTAVMSVSGDALPVLVAPSSFCAAGLSSSSRCASCGSATIRVAANGGGVEVAWYTLGPVAIANGKCVRDLQSHPLCTCTTITMSSSLGSTRKRALSDPDVSDVHESDTKKTKSTDVDYGQPSSMAQPHWPIRSVSSLLQYR